MNWQKSNMFHFQHETNVQQNEVWRICEANVSHLDENIAALWVWLNSSKSDDLQTDAFSTSSVSVKEKISFGFVGHHCRDITRS